MNVLICSQYGEFQVDEVCRQLKDLGANPVIFERYRKDQFISYHYTPGVKGVLRTADEEYPLTPETFPAVWYRPKPIILGEIPGETAKIKERFCIQEWRVILQSLDLFLAQSKWINPIGSHLKASNKAFQLKLAGDVGLKIPQTLITNDASKALTLFKKNRVIYKTLSSFFTAEGTIYTNEVYAEQISLCQQEIAMAPGIFQEYIEKHYELRVTVIGEKIFVVKIDSQNKQESAIDWRKGHHVDMYQQGELSKETRERLKILHTKLNLIYGAYDFIVDKEGQEIFLECNPSGQWLWLEHLLKVDISEAMAKELISC